MRDSTSRVRLFCCGLSAIVAACAAPEDPVVSTTTAGREPSAAISRVREPSLEVPDGSLAALTAEVRQLRAAVEKLARSQTETQALAAYLSAQQSRMAQTAQQLDAARKELDSANVRSRDVEARLGDISAALAGTVDRDERARLDDGMRGFKAEQSRVALELEQARTRESDLSGQLQAEERRWNELISRIEQLSQ